MCWDFETCGLLNHCKYKIIEEATRIRVGLRDAYGLKKHGLTRSDCKPFSAKYNGEFGIILVRKFGIQYMMKICSS